MVNWKKVKGLIAIIVIILAMAAIEKVVLDYCGLKNSQEPVKNEIEKAITEKGLNVEFIFRENLQVKEEETNKAILPIYYSSSDKFINSVQPRTRVYSSLAVSGSDSVKKTYWTFIPDHAGFIVYKMTYEQNQQVSIPDGYDISSNMITFNQNTINYEYGKSLNSLESLFVLFLFVGTPVIGIFSILIIAKSINS